MIKEDYNLIEPGIKDITDLFQQLSLILGLNKPRLGISLRNHAQVLITLPKTYNFIHFKCLFFQLICNFFSPLNYCSRTFTFLLLCFIEFLLVVFLGLLPF